jgi:hypothetical protein
VIHSQQHPLSASMSFAIYTNVEVFNLELSNLEVSSLRR